MDQEQTAAHRVPPSEPEEKPSPAPPAALSRRSRFLVVASTLLALFLAALDALIMGAAMPTIVADLGGLHLYSWVFSAYLLTRAVSLPIFGKLADLLGNKSLYGTALFTFLAGSVLAGAANGMTQLIVFRALQGIGAGGVFALAYIVVADISPVEQRGRMMSLISFVWGIASILGPTLGGLIVTYLSWRWIFYMNIPLGGLALAGIFVYLREGREKQKEAHIDYLGALTLTTTILTLLIAFLLGGRTYPWTSPLIAGLLLATLVSGWAFYKAERRAKEPIFPLRFFRNPGFGFGNGAAFCSSFAILSLVAYSPLFIQGALGKTPAQLGMAMVPLSLGWSVGALVCGQLIHRLRKKPSALAGAFLLAAGSGLTLTFTPSTPLWACSGVLTIAGLGMGFVSISTLLVVQESLTDTDLGIATASHQFARTLGGTLGTGVSGSLVTAHLAGTLENLKAEGLFDRIPPSVSAHMHQSLETLFRPEIQSAFPDPVRRSLQEAMGQGVELVFWVALIASLFNGLFCRLLPKRETFESRNSKFETN